MKPSHLLVLLVVVLIVFGAPKLPEIARSIGQSLKIFKKEVSELTEDDTPKQLPPQQQYQQPAQPYEQPQQQYQQPPAQQQPQAPQAPQQQPPVDPTTGQPNSQ